MAVRSNYLLYIHVYAHRFVLLATLVREASFYSAHRFVQKLISSQSANSKQLLGAQLWINHLLNLPYPRLREHPIQSGKDVVVRKEGCYELLTSGHHLAVTQINSQNLWQPYTRPNQSAVIIHETGTLKTPSLAKELLTVNSCQEKKIFL